jgi:hypothetical protein
VFDDIVAAVADLTEKSGQQFRVTDAVVDNTDLYVVYASGHPFPARYTVESGILGFRVPRNFPDACPEDSFFVQPDTIRLKERDPVRNSYELNRTGSNRDFLKGTILGANPALVFSWHIWNNVPWNRRTHTLVDHYAHCLRRFEQEEHG